MASPPGGRVIDISLEMTRVTLDVLERTIFTHGLARDPTRSGAPSPAISRPGTPRSIGHLRLAGLGAAASDVCAPGRRSASSRRWSANWSRAERRSFVGGETAPRDLLTLLLEAADPETGKGLTDLEVGANIVTFIGAGHETTANALSWSLYLLSQDPVARASIEREVDEVLGEGAIGPEHLERLVYTRAVIDEAMRLYPPVPILSRAAIADDRIGDLKIPARSIVTIAPYVLHRHRNLWDEPDAFMPERFLPDDRKAAIDRFAYLPFGAGPRVCIGASFSLQEAVIVLATIVRGVRLDLVEGHEVVPVHRITLRPQGRIADAAGCGTALGTEKQSAAPLEASACLALFPERVQADDLGAAGASTSSLSFTLPGLAGLSAFGAALSPSPTLLGASFGALLLVAAGPAQRGISWAGARPARNRRRGSAGTEPDPCRSARSGPRPRISGRTGPRDRRNR